MLVQLTLFYDTLKLRTLCSLLYHFSPGGNPDKTNISETTCVDYNVLDPTPPHLYTTCLVNQTILFSCKLPMHIARTTLRSFLLVNYMCNHLQPGGTSYPVPPNETRTPLAPPVNQSVTKVSFYLF